MSTQQIQSDKIDFVVSLIFPYLLQQGKALIDDEHPAEPEIKKTMADLNTQWKDLYDKSMDKGNKLRQASQQHALNKALADAQVRDKHLTVNFSSRSDPCGNERKYSYFLYIGSGVS